MNAHPITTFPGSCKRALFRKSNCQECLEICLEKVIFLGSAGPTINYDCSECGLCQNVCPTEVFQHELHTDPYLLLQIRSLRDKHNFPEEKKKLFIHCHRVEGEYQNSFLLSCLGRITENIILGAAILGFDEIVLTSGICSQCRFQHGEKFLANAITISRVLLEGLGLAQFSIRKEEKEKRKEQTLSRRELFFKISHKVKEKGESFIYRKGNTLREKLTGKPESDEGTRLSPRRELLRKLIKQKRWGNAVVLKYQEKFPWGKIKIDEKTCSACGTCIALCPRGAISKKLENGYQCMYFNSSVCTNCALCMEACPKKALSFEGEFALSDIFEEEAHVVARIKLARCVLCGEIIATEGTKLCPTCQKRQVRPTHIKI